MSLKMLNMQSSYVAFSFNLNLGLLEKIGRSRLFTLQFVVFNRFVVYNLTICLSKFLC